MGSLFCRFFLSYSAAASTSSSSVLVVVFVGETNARGNFAAAKRSNNNSYDMRQKTTCNNACRLFVYIPCNLLILYGHIVDGSVLKYV